MVLGVEICMVSQPLYSNLTGKFIKRLDALLNNKYSMHSFCQAQKVYLELDRILSGSALTYSLLSSYEAEDGVCASPRKLPLLAVSLEPRDHLARACVLRGRISSCVALPEQVHSFWSTQSTGEAIFQLALLPCVARSFFKAC